MLPLQNAEQLDATIKAIRRRFPKHTAPLADYRPAAVLIPFFFKDDRAQVLFTKRSQQVRHHKGQISFPGGTLDDEDTDLRAAALRETEEEIGVKTDDIHIIAEIDEMVTPTKFHITPFVGTIPYPYTFQINPAEIDELIEIPLSHLLDPVNHRTYERPLPIDPKRIVTVHSYQYGPHEVWGITGHILHNLISKMQQLTLETL